MLPILSHESLEEVKQLKNKYDHQGGAMDRNRWKIGKSTTETIYMILSVLTMNI